MRNLKLALEVDNRASAIVTGTGNAVKLEVDPELMWDREGLLKLSAALTSIAGSVRNTAIVLAVLVATRSPKPI